MMHGCSKMGTALAFDTTTRELRRYPRVGAGSDFFFLFLRIPVDLAPIRTDLALIRTKPGRFGQNWVVSAESERIGWWPKLTETAETDQNGRNRP